MCSLQVRTSYRANKMERIYCSRQNRANMWAERMQLKIFTRTQLPRERTPLRVWGISSHTLRADIAPFQFGGILLTCEIKHWLTIGIAVMANRSDQNNPLGVTEFAAQESSFRFAVIAARHEALLRATERAVCHAWPCQRNTFSKREDGFIKSQRKSVIPAWRLRKYAVVSRRRINRVRCPTLKADSMKRYGQDCLRY